MSTLVKIEQKIRRLSKGVLVFVSDFSDIYSYESVRKSLQRLEKKGTLIRIAKGIYYYPKKDAVLGIVFPSVDQIAKALAKRDKARIVPTGAYASHLLGLSKQIPMNIIYLTDGSARKVTIKNQTIVFKKASPKNLSFQSPLSSLIIQALKTIKEPNVSKKDKKLIKKVIFKSQEIKFIKEDIINAPVWIQKIIQKIILEYSNELA